MSPPIDPASDHVLGPPDAENYARRVRQLSLPLLSYGARGGSPPRRAVRERLRYVYRHLPLADRSEATRAAELAEYVAATSGDFWLVHDSLMRRGPVFAPGELESIAAQFGVPPQVGIAVLWKPTLTDGVSRRTVEEVS
jgi:NhaA family Na+:H+ antiporter